MLLYFTKKICSVFFVLYSCTYIAENLKTKEVEIKLVGSHIRCHTAPLKIYQVIHRFTLPHILHL